ncbi:nitroreductase family protein [Prauserella cavernicola]|uniref:Nitroreductase family protein n=1 Tax=Prauserella cavernicola TaxID=2800127 RepID=A0A934QR40_9PSEU|nr:nitroreductase family protein [Prauserella cavernicola]MBK1785045.1 nitroreductase family protein [Prauserella cavernicola]
MSDKEAETSVPVHDLIATRWSPRALDDMADVTRDQLRALLEAARWAPSFGNTQPTRFLVGRRGDPGFDRILGTLTTRNQSWAHRAGALLVVLALTHNEKGDMPYAEYGAGLAAENLVLQAVAEGLVAHQMAGFDAEAVSREFGLPSEVRPLVAVAVGQLGDPEVLGDERSIDRETAPRERVALDEFALSDWGTPAF